MSKNSIAKDEHSELYSLTKSGVRIPGAYIRGCFIQKAETFILKDGMILLSSGLSEGYDRRSIDLPQGCDADKVIKLFEKWIDIYGEPDSSTSELLDKDSGLIHYRKNGLQIYNTYLPEKILKNLINLSVIKDELVIEYSLKGLTFPESKKFKLPPECDPFLAAKRVSEWFETRSSAETKTVSKWFLWV